MFDNKEQLPSFICTDCHYKLDISFQYQLLCKESDLKLREYLINCEKQNNTAVNEDEIQAAMQELFGNEGTEQQISNPVNPMYHSNLMLPVSPDASQKIQNIKCSSPPVNPRLPKHKHHFSSIITSHKQTIET